MSLVAMGRRVGPFVLFADDDGLRHAVKLGVVMALSDTDTLQTATLMMMPGGRTVLIREPLDEVAKWFS